MDRPFFFLHLMKTGGSTFLWNLRANFDEEAVYPLGRIDGPEADSYRKLAFLRAVPPERRARLAGYTGHFPYFAVKEIDPSPIVFTILRDPIERTVSHLRQAARRHEQHRGLPLEEIYDDPFFFRWFIHNHQSKVFAFRPDDGAESIMNYLEVDEQRLAEAKANLAELDLVGFTDEFTRFLSAAEARYGWTLDSVENANVATDEMEASPELLRRIESDNAADIEFYEYARTLDQRA